MKLKELLITYPNLTSSSRLFVGYAKDLCSNDISNAKITTMAYMIDCGIVEKIQAGQKDDIHLERYRSQLSYYGLDSNLIEACLTEMISITDEIGKTAPPNVTKIIEEEKTNNRRNKFDKTRQIIKDAFEWITDKTEDIVTSDLFQSIILFSPIVLSVIFSIVFFANTKQIRAVSNVVGWTYAWIFYIVGAIVFVYNGKTNEDFLKKSKYIVLVIQIIVCIVVSANAFNLMIPFKPSKMLEFALVDKEEGTAEYNYTKLVFKITNLTSTEINYVWGKMTFYDGKEELETWNVSFTGEFDPKESSKKTLTFRADETPAIYNTSYEQLSIVFKIKKMCFRDDLENEVDFTGDKIKVKKNNKHITSVFF